MYTFHALASQPIKQPPAWYCPDVNCLLHIRSLCIHISRSSPSCNLIVLFCIKKTIPNSLYFGKTKCWHIVFLILGLNCMQSVIMWYLIQNAFINWLNDWPKSMQSEVPAIMEKVLVSENAGFYWSNVYSKLVAWPKEGASASLETARWCQLPSRPKTRWLYRMTVKNDQWQLPHGNKETLMTFHSSSAWCIEGVNGP